MIENRIRELRKNHSMSQEALGAIINTTQQTVSKMEKSTFAISTDLLINMSYYFNVTTDYILGISDIKRDLNGQLRMNQELEKCYDIVLRYNNLSEINKKKYSSDRDTLRVECKSAVFHADFLLLRLSRFGNSTGSDASS